MYVPTLKNTGLNGQVLLFWRQLLNLLTPSKIAPKIPTLMFRDLSNMIFTTIEQKSGRTVSKCTAVF